MSPDRPRKAGAPVVLALALLIAFHAVSNFIIVRADNTPLLWDGGDYFYRSLRFYDLFARPAAGFLSRLNEISPYRPPLFMLNSLPFYLLFGRSPDAGVMSLLPFLAVLLLAVYGIGRRLEGPSAGLLAAFAVSVFPIIFGLSRSYWSDLPLAAMVSLSIYLLIMTRGFADATFSLLFGISAGLGMLTKWTFFIFLAAPLALCLLLRVEDGAAPRRWKHAGLSLLAAACVSAFWYLPNGLAVAGKLMDLAFGAGGGEGVTTFQNLGESIGPSGIFTAKSLTYYAGTLVNSQIGFFFTVILLLLLAAARRLERRTLWLLLSWIVVPVFFFTLIKNKTPRNTVPMLPAIALLMSLAAMRLRSARARSAAVLAILLGGLLQYAAVSYGAAWLPRRLAVATPLGDAVIFQQYENPSYAVFRARKGDWKADEILGIIRANSNLSREAVIVLIPRDAFTWMAMEYLSYLKGFPFRFIGAVDQPEAVATADFVLVKRGGFVAPWFLMRNIHRSLAILEENMGRFEPIGEVELPEESPFLTIWDAESPPGRRADDLVFSGAIRVIDHAVTKSGGASGETITVEATILPLEKVGESVSAVINGADRKMNVVFRQQVAMDPPPSTWVPGEERRIRAVFEIPAAAAADVFTLEMGFADRSRQASLTCRPRYLIYRTRRGEREPA